MARILFTENSQVSKTQVPKNIQAHASEPKFKVAASNIIGITSSKHDDVQQVHEAKAKRHAAIWRNTPSEPGSKSKQNLEHSKENTHLSKLPKISSNAPSSSNSQIRSSFGHCAGVRSVEYEGGICQKSGSRPSTSHISARSGTLDAALDAMETDNVMPSSTMPMASTCRVDIISPKIIQSKPKPSFNKNADILPDDNHFVPNDDGKARASTQDSGSNLGIGQNQPPPFKLRRRTLILDWPDDVEFDEKEEVVAIDKDGKYHMVSASIQPHVVWHADDVKFCVTFNEFCQPLKRGGYILVKFNVAKNERFRPIRVTDWRNINAQYKADIIKIIRAHFVIPEDDCYDHGILK